VPTALITGIAGQDGAYLACLLREKGYHVVGLVQPGTVIDPPVARLLGETELMHGDLRDGLSLRDAVAASDPDEVYNLAGISSVALSWNEPERTADVNAIGVLRLVRALVAHSARTGRMPRLLQASSAEIFGHAEVSPQDESTPLRPRNPYAVSKAFAHEIVATYRQGSGLAASTVILYNHESPLRPPTFVSRKITRTVAEIALGRTDRLVLGDLDAQRDWGHAVDYARAMWLALQHDEPGDYVVATGQVHSVREFAAAAFAVVGITDWQSHVSTDQEFVRPTEAGLLVGDANRARKVLGWAPEVDFAGLVSAMVQFDLDELGRDP
jgi:GDPmannose 4,6-dehydratase